MRSRRRGYQPQGCFTALALSPRFNEVVIASEAKQSILRRASRVDCFVALLLAMTDVGPASRVPTAGLLHGPSSKSSFQRSRHCERSEAIHLTAGKRRGLLRRFAPRNDG